MKNYSAKRNRIRSINTYRWVTVGDTITVILLLLSIARGEAQNRICCYETGNNIVILEALSEYEYPFPTTIPFFFPLPMKGSARHLQVVYILPPFHCTQKEGPEIVSEADDTSYTYIVTGEDSTEAVAAHGSLLVMVTVTWSPSVNRFWYKHYYLNQQDCHSVSTGMGTCSGITIYNIKLNRSICTCRVCIIPSDQYRRRWHYGLYNNTIWSSQNWYNWRYW